MNAAGRAWPGLCALACVVAGGCNLIFDLDGFEFADTPPPDAGPRADAPVDPDADRPDGAPHPCGCADDREGCWAGTCDVPLDVATGVDVTCAAMRSGRVLCWGDNAAGLMGDERATDRAGLVEVSGIADARLVAVGDVHACAAADGTVYCWGWATDGRLGPTVSGAGLFGATMVSAGETVVSLAAGGEHTCAVRMSGSLECWGENDEGQIGIGDDTESEALPRAPVGVGGETFLSVTAGDAHTCALSGAGEVWCWGRDRSEEVGDGTDLVDEVVAPVKIWSASGGEATAIAAGHSHTCLIAGEQLHCWGFNDEGEIAGVTGRQIENPTVVPGLTAVRAVAGGEGHTCVVAGDALRCWGDSTRAQVGELRLTRAPITTVRDSVGGDVQLEGGSDATCLRSVELGHLACWGSNAHDQAGTGRTRQVTAAAAATALPIGDSPVIAAGSGFACAASTMATTCWGENELRQLGAADPFDHSIPVEVSGGVPLGGLLTAGAQHACAGDATRVYCWGRNADRQAGESVAEVVASPRPMALTGALELAAGDAFTCARRSDDVVCWGRNLDGELAEPDSLEETATPTPIDGVGRASAIGAGAGHACAVLDDGVVRCWGRNDRGQIGNGAMSSTPVRAPAPVTGLSDAVAVALGGAFSCALDMTGDVQCWGDNTYGQLGGGAVGGEALTPAPAGVSAVTQIAAGNEHACALLETGIIACWGRNQSGQLGDGTLADRAAPGTIADLPGVVALAAGGDFTCAATSDGTLRCWGANDQGQLGDGTPLVVEMPAAVLGSPPLP